MNAAFLLAQTVWRLFLLLVSLTLVGLVMWGFYGICLLTVRHPSVVVPVDMPFLGELGDRPCDARALAAADHREVHRSLTVR